jgi:hypothetical protein
MLGLPLSFAAPLVLGALLALPAIWLLLRVTPPQPRRIDFPPLRIVQDLLPRQETPARTPWWLLALRLALAALLIMAAAGPIWNPTPGDETDGPLLIVVDNGFTAAHDWRERAGLATERVEAAGRAGRPVALLATADRPADLRAAPPASALERLRAVRPQPHLPDRSAHLPAIERFIASQAGAEIVWISDGVAGSDEQAFAAGLAKVAPSTPVAIFRNDRAMALAVAAPENAAAGMSVRVLRAQANGRDAGSLRASDLKGLPLADAPFTFAADGLEATALFDLPIEVRNAIARIEILGEGSAGAVTLVDERGKRRRVGIVSGTTIDQSQPLLSPTYYVSRALGPYAEIREARGGVAESVGQLIDEQVSVLVLADVGALDRDTLARVTGFVENGGLLLRFAGSRLAAGNDDLVPTRLRRGGRSLGGTLSWDTPRTFAPFTRESPFFGMPVPRDLGVRRQILAEPDGDLPRKTWASLEDGTPIVTADKRGEGMVVLFHVTADATWSNLPLSGLFVDMLRRVVAFAGAPNAPAAEPNAAQVPPVAPTRTLDGFGVMGAPPATARPVARDYVGRATADHPPGFYGPQDSSIAVNALLAQDRLAPLDFAALPRARQAPLVRAETLDLRAHLLTLALLLLLVDTVVSLWLGGHLGGLMGRIRRRAAPAALLLAAACLTWPGSPLAQTPQPFQTLGAESALVTRLAYVLTGDGTVDGISKAGLTGLTQILAARTALEPGEPTGVDLTRDELAFFPVLYWPLVANRPSPSVEAVRKLDTFMKNGGTVIFDTRDALGGRGTAQSPEAQQLQRILATLDVPELEPVPRDHVLTKTFYILENFPGRYAGGQTWIEALPPPAADGERRPARGGDGVSPIIITSNDLAAAWAVGRRGEALYPVVGTDPRQREMSMRAGVNMIMYALTGNYKADQVHIPAILERLGQ